MATNMSAGANALTTLKNKMQTLREEVDKAKDHYEQKCQELEREKALREETDNDLAALSRKLRVLEDEAEKTQAELQLTNEKFVELGKFSDESERARKALQNRQHLDDERMTVLERMVREATQAGNEAEKKYEEVVRRLLAAERELEKAEERADTAETRVKQLDSELHIATTTLKSLTLNESKHSKKEDMYEATIRDLTVRLKDVESRSDQSERLASKLQKDVDQMEEALQRIKDENKSLQQEMDAAFQEIQSI